MPEGVFGQGALPSLVPGSSCLFNLIELFHLEVWLNTGLLSPSCSGRASRLDTALVLFSLVFGQRRFSAAALLQDLQGSVQQ